MKRTGQRRPQLLFDESENIQWERRNKCGRVTGVDRDRIILSDKRRYIKGGNYKIMKAFLLPHKVAAGIYWLRQETPLSWQVELTNRKDSVRITEGIGDRVVYGKEIEIE